MEYRLDTRKDTPAWAGLDRRLIARLADPQGPAFSITPQAMRGPAFPVGSVL